MNNDDKNVQQSLKDKKKEECDPEDLDDECNEDIEVIEVNPDELPEGISVAICQNA